MVAVLPALHVARLSRRGPPAPRSVPDPSPAGTRGMQALRPEIGLLAGCSAAGRAVSLPALPAVLRLEFGAAPVQSADARSSDCGDASSHRDGVGRSSARRRRRVER